MAIVVVVVSDRSGRGATQSCHQFDAENGDELDCEWYAGGKINASSTCAA